MADLNPSGFAALGDALAGGGAMAQVQGALMGQRFADMGAQTAQAIANARLARQKYSGIAQIEATPNSVLMDSARAPYGTIVALGQGGSYNSVVQGRDRAFMSNPDNMNTPAYTAASAGVTGKLPTVVPVPNQFTVAPGVAPPAITVSPVGQAAINQQNARANYYDAFGGRGGGRLPAGYQPDPDHPGHLMPIPGGPADHSAGASNLLGNPQLTGDAYLQSISDPGLRATVKAIAEGREEVPRIYRSGNGGQIGPTQLAAAVNQYDPSFNQQDFNSRNRLRIDATSGQMARNMRSLNQAAVHLGQLATQVGGTSGIAAPLVGGLLNRALNATEDPYTGDVTRYQTSADAVAHEVRALFAGTSGGTLQELDGYLRDLSANNSTAQKRAAIGNIAQLIHSRIAILKDQYNQGMQGAADPFSVVFPHAKGTLDTLIGLENGSAPSAPPAAPASTGMAPAVAAAPTGAHAPAPVHISSDAEWNALAPGTLFMGPDGHIRRK